MQLAGIHGVAPARGVNAARFGGRFPALENAEERKQKSPTVREHLGPRLTRQMENLMSNTIVQQHEYAVKRCRFVPAAPPDQTERLERQIGRNLYMRGRDISECVTDAMTAGYLAAEAKGADDYYRCMMAEASADKPARWTGEDF